LPLIIIGIFIIKNKIMSEEINKDFAFGKQNYILLVAGTVIAVIGYVLMSGGGSEDPAVFSEDIFSFRRMYIAPILILIGLAVVGWGIMKKAD
jgi:cytochrome bd-type quinol oxidase subunit 2